MSCDSIGPELIPFHFGNVDPGIRDAVESHLLGCEACLRSFLALKRDLETADDVASQESRDRLRLQMLRELRTSERVRWRWWERPLAVVVAATAALVAVLAVHGVATGPGAPPRGASQQWTPTSAGHP